MIYPTEQVASLTFVCHQYWQLGITHEGLNSATKEMSWSHVCIYIYGYFSSQCQPRGDTPFIQYNIPSPSIEPKG